MKGREFLGLILVLVGGLAALLTGGCTLVVIFASAGSGALAGIPMALLIGGIPFLFSLLLCFGGVFLMAPEKKKDEHE